MNQQGTIGVVGPVATIVEMISFAIIIISTEARRANGRTDSLEGEYDRYVECIKLIFDNWVCSVKKLMEYIFEIIVPYSINKQGTDVVKKYRTGIYSTSEVHLESARIFINKRRDRDKIAVPLSNLFFSSFFR